MIFLRHPTPKVPKGLCYGRMDVEVGPNAKAEIACALRFLPPIRCLVSSPARRCRVLADEIAHRDGIDATYDDRLRELDFGLWEGQSWDKIDRSESDLWADNFWDVAPPGGEAFSSLHARVKEVILSLSGRESVAIVAHGGPIRAARMILTGASAETVFAETVAFATPIHFDHLSGAV